MFSYLFPVLMLLVMRRLALWAAELPVTDVDALFQRRRLCAARLVR